MPVIASEAHRVNRAHNRVDVVFYQVLQPISEHEVILCNSLWGLNWHSLELAVFISQENGTLLI